MTQDEMLISLRAEAKRINRHVPDTAWYLFGSALQNPEQATDIDVLILCATDEGVALIRRELCDACMRLPLHLLLLTPLEEAELGFIAAAGCIQVYPMSECSAPSGTTR